MPCKCCDGTGLYVERREGADYAYSCNVCTAGEQVRERAEQWELRDLAEERNAPTLVSE